MDHIRSGTKKTYNSGWLWFCDFCREREVDPMTASVQCIVKFIRHCFELSLTYFVVRNAISAISKYHITGDSGLTMGHHPLVRRARKAFWQNNPPLPKYRGTWDAKIILRFIENLGENDSLSLELLSFKTAFLLAFSTMARCCLYQLCPDQHSQFSV